MRFDLSKIWFYKPYGGWRKIFPILRGVLGLLFFQFSGMLVLYTVSLLLGFMPSFGLVVSMMLAFLLFYLKYNLVKRNWHLLNLGYEISKEGITFRWGTINEHTFFLPYEHILKVTHVGFDNSEYSKIYFHTLHVVLKFDFDHLTDDDVNLICMEEIPNGKKVFELIEYLRTGELIGGTDLERILIKRELSKLDKISLHPSY